MLTLGISCRAATKRRRWAPAGAELYGLPIRLGVALALPPLARWRFDLGPEALILVDTAETYDLVETKKSTRVVFGLGGGGDSAPGLGAWSIASRARWWRPCPSRPASWSWPSRAARWRSSPPPRVVARVMLGLTYGFFFNEGREGRARSFPMPPEHVPASANILSSMHKAAAPDVRARARPFWSRSASRARSRRGASSGAPTPDRRRLPSQMGVREPDLEDVCQNVFVQMVRYLADFRGESSLKTWLYRICLSESKELRRKRRLRDLLLGMLSAQPPPPPVWSWGRVRPGDASRKRSTG